MANCADCGRNPKRGCLPECPRDKTRSVWARYRARKKAKGAVYVLEPGATAAEIRATYDAAKTGDTIVVMPVNQEKFSA